MRPIIDFTRAEQGVDTVRAKLLPVNLLIFVARRAAIASRTSKHPKLRCSMKGSSWAETPQSLNLRAHYPFTKAAG